MHKFENLILSDYCIILIIVFLISQRKNCKIYISGTIKIYPNPQFLMKFAFVFSFSFNRFWRNGIVDFLYLLLLAKFTLYTSLLLNCLFEWLNGNNFFAFSCLILFFAKFRQSLILLSLNLCWSSQIFGWRLETLYLTKEIEEVNQEARCSCSHFILGNCFSCCR